MSHKIHAGVHGVRDECHTWRDVNNLLRLYFMMALDSGPEEAFPSLYFQPQAVYPHWCAPSFDEDPADGLQPQDGEEFVSMDQCLKIPGVFHAMNNMQKRTLRQLSLWEKHERRIDSCAYYFHHRHCKDTFTETCLVGDKLLWRCDFKDSPPTMDGGRVWGVVIAIAQYFTERETKIRETWNILLVSFRQGNNDDGGDITVDRAHLQRANEAFTDDECWATFWLLVIL